MAQRLCLGFEGRGLPGGGGGAGGEGGNVGHLMYYMKREQGSGTGAWEVLLDISTTLSFVLFRGAGGGREIFVLEGLKSSALSSTLLLSFVYFFSIHLLRFNFYYTYLFLFMTCAA